MKQRKGKIKLTPFLQKKKKKSYIAYSPRDM